MEQTPIRVHGIRYQTRGLDRAVAFYTEHLVSDCSTSREKPVRACERTIRESGGWNRLVLAVHHLPALVVAMRNRGLRFRSEIVSGPGGRQIQLLDPDDNAIELCEPA